VQVNIPDSFHGNPSSGKHHPGDDLRDVFELADADDNGKISPQDSSDIFVDRCGGFVQKIFNTVLSVD